MDVELSHDDKLEILSLVKSWRREQTTQENLRKIQKHSGIPARSIEMMFWHYDTLSLLKESEWLVFKGGTCVQSWIPSGMQRASVDLDLNSSVANPNAIREKISRINEIIRKENRALTVHGIDFGSIEYRSIDKISGTLNFSRRMPSRFREMVKVGDHRVQGIDLRIQINYKNAWLPAISPIMKEPSFLILDHGPPLERYEFIHSSKEDLIADKILATCNVHGFGRERFKDVYDLGILLSIEKETALVLDKLERIGARKRGDPSSFIKGSIETISDFSERSAEARGFGSMVGSDGKERIKEWEGFCFSTIDRLKEIS